MGKCHSLTWIPGETTDSRRIPHRHIHRLVQPCACDLPARRNKEARNQCLPCTAGRALLRNAEDNPPVSGWYIPDKYDDCLNKKPFLRHTVYPWKAGNCLIENSSHCP